MESSLKNHFVNYDDNPDNYFNDVLKIFKDEVLKRNTTKTVKANILTTLIQRKDIERFKILYEHLDIPEVLGACNILDANRFKRQLERQLNKTPDSKRIKKTIKQLDHLIDGVIGLSLNSSRINIIKGWVNFLTPSRLEYRALLFNLDSWKKLCDLLHLNPEKDFSLKWFQPYCYGKPAPLGTIVNDFNNLTNDNFIELYNKHKFDYEIVRTKFIVAEKKSKKSKKNAITKSKNVLSMNDQTKKVIIDKENINTVLWYLDELINPTNETNLLNRIIIEKDNMNLSYGKMIDIIARLTNKETIDEMMKIANSKKETYHVNVERPVAVFGDQSSSMEIAIKTSGIITSLLTYICDASLDLFHSANNHIENPPREIREAIDFGKNIKTQGMTCPASSLGKYYDEKKVIKTIIIITDEEENTQCKIKNTEALSRISGLLSEQALESIPKFQQHTYDFARLYMKYHQEIYPAKIVFISFSDPNHDAMMARELKKSLGEDYDKYVKVFKFDVKNPDLNRMDIVLKHLSEA